MHAIKFATACVIKGSMRAEGWLREARGGFSNKIYFDRLFLDLSLEVFEGG